MWKDYKRTAKHHLQQRECEGEAADVARRISFLSWGSFPQQRYICSLKSRLGSPSLAQTQDAQHFLRSLPLWDHT